MTFQTTLDFSKEVKMETVSDGVTCAWMNDHRIALYRFDERARNQDADAWYNSVTRRLHTSPFYIRFIHDFSACKITNHLYQKIDELSNFSAAYRGRVTFVFPTDISPQHRVDILRAFNVRRLPNWSVSSSMYSRYGAVDRAMLVDKLISDEIDLIENQLLGPAKTEHRNRR